MPHRPTVGQAFPHTSRGPLPAWRVKSSDVSVPQGRMEAGVLPVSPGLRGYWPGAGAGWTARAVQRMAESLGGSWS